MHDHDDRSSLKDQRFSSRGQRPGHRDDAPSFGDDGSPREDDKPYKDDRPSYKEELIEDIKTLDRHILKLLGRRSRLAAKAFKTRVRRGPDTAQEMDLWRVWEDDTTTHGGDPKLIRRLFDMVQSLDMRKAQGPADEAPTGFLLTPRREPLAVDIPGPTSPLAARIWAVLAAQAEAPLHLARVLVNDPLVGLVKALNQMGATLSWEEGALVSRGAGRARLLADAADGPVYVGDDLTNFHLLAPLALTRHGQIRFTGGPDLKGADLRPLDKVLPRLGARLSPVVPKSWGLPVRVETSGVAADGLDLSSDLAAGLAPAAVLGLALAAPTFERGLTLTWDADLHVAAELHDLLIQAAESLALFGIPAELAPGRLAVTPGVPVPPAASELLPLAPIFSASLLALPAALAASGREGGSVRLTGRWPRSNAGAEALLDLLRQAGLDVTVDAEGVRAACAAGAACPAALRPGLAAHVPLACALAAGWAMADGRKVRVLCPPDVAAAAAGPATEFCARLGLAVDVFGADAEADASGETDDAGASGLVLTPSGVQRRRTAWLAPSAAWGLALSLAALARPGLGLGNPAVVSAELPGYWSVYNGLPAPVATFYKYATPKESGDVPTDGQPARRRIKL
jgi:5-enolpyruvylshikimate-3-phosphate synthase/chorismate mutase